MNIATVLNLLPRALRVRVEYRDLSGALTGQVTTTIAPNLKTDFIVNDLGLMPDSYGTVCVDTDAVTDGAWIGGISVYKPNRRTPASEGHDYALYEPFTNEFQGTYTVPLNTFHLGTPSENYVANWTRIADADAADGERLQGRIVVYNDSGEQVAETPVNIPNGGRVDYATHDLLAGRENIDAVGMARFIPNLNSRGENPKFYLTSGRYFYDCARTDFLCSNMLTAFTMPYRPATTNPILGGVSTKDGLSIIEMNNIGGNPVNARISVNVADGISAGNTSMLVPGLATRHLILNRNGSQGFLGDNTVASAVVNSAPGYLSSLSLFYKLENGRLQYGFAAPFAGPPAEAQISEFNSFIGNTNRSELYNFTPDPIQSSLDILNFDGSLIASQQFTIPGHGTQEYVLPVPADTYGSLVIQSNRRGLVFRNYVTGNQYVIPFIGK